MIEVILCSLITVLPDFLVRRFVQGKRIGHEITLFSVWHELRWGITACVILSVSLITVIFYYHPTTLNVISSFRTVTILSENAGRVSDVMVANNEAVEAGQPIFKLDSSSQQASIAAAERKVAEIDASMPVAQAELAAAQAMLAQAQAAFQQTRDELDRKLALKDRGSAALSAQEVERLENLVNVRQGAIDAAIANQQTVQARLDTLIPAQRASAVAALDQAQIELAKQTIRAGTAGRVEQFTLRVGDIINPILRPAGILIPDNIGRGRFQAAFGQIASSILKPGMFAEITCISQPFTVIPMVVTLVQDVIATGQIRPSDQLIDISPNRPPGHIIAYLEPLYTNQQLDIPPGSQCVANAYSSFHNEIASGELPLQDWLFYHMVDAVAGVHAAILRIQALILPVKILVLSGH